MIKVGIDIVEVKRIERLFSKYQRRFLERVFTKEEIEDCLSYKNYLECLAGRFAVKEAVIKTLGGGFLYKKIETRRGEGGKPVLYVEGIDDSRWDVSISHAGGIAVAVVLRFVDNV